MTFSTTSFQTKQRKSLSLHRSLVSPLLLEELTELVDFVETVLCVGSSDSEKDIGTSLSLRESEVPMFSPVSVHRSPE